MSSGYIHDRITLWSLPVVTVLSLVVTRSSDLTLIVAGGFLFGGLMFSPDLDLYSRPFKRWGWLRWIWIPYQRMVPHRSIFSHGPVIGTILRLLYLANWLVLFGGVGLLVFQLFQDEPDRWLELIQGLGGRVWEYRTWLMACVVGLELGAIAHFVSDWGSSAYKQFKKGGITGLWSPKQGRSKGRGAGKSKPQRRKARKGKGS
ncbi:MAG: metal-binding protein [Moorea sp. SIO4A1]|uniref:metal-binding protein n=1 Tax=Moorena sp. SIO4A1 TaxID=2607835 RepID=UPI00144F3690|nr:metal-binding protein [Moorena sp. SIO4A1]NEQ60192.1 metal-binding protein [Moorena sp. SIO4A1]